MELDRVFHYKDHEGHEEKAKIDLQPHTFFFIQIFAVPVVCLMA